MKWQDYFLQAKLLKTPVQEEGYELFPLDGGWIQIPRTELTDRERFLLKLLSGEKLDVAHSYNPWEDFLLGEGQVIPDILKAYQFLYIEHSQALTEELIDLLHQFLVGRTILISVGEKRTALLLTQKQDSDLNGLLQELIVTIESDFGLSLSFFLGNSWAKLEGSALRPIFQSENSLFSQFLGSHHSEKMQSFPQMLLWALSNGLDISIIKESIHYYLSLQAEVTDVIAALWECHGNQVQAAQKLYLHRNSLQYKLEKFQNLSGLNLKKLDDLALCHWFLLENH